MPQLSLLVRSFSTAVTGVTTTLLLLLACPAFSLQAAESDEHAVDARGGTVRQNARMDDGSPKPFAADKNISTSREAHLLHLMEKTVTPPPGLQFRPFKGNEVDLDASITKPDPTKPVQLPIYVRIPKYVDILSAPDCCFNVDVTDIEGMIHALTYNSQASAKEGPSSITVSGIMPEEDHAGQFPLRIEGNLITPSGRAGGGPHWAAKIGSIQILVDRNHDGSIDGKDNTGKRLRFADRNKDNKYDDSDNPRDDMPGAVFMVGFGLANHPKLGERIKAEIKYPRELNRGVLRLRILEEHEPSNVEVQNDVAAPSRNRHIRVYKDVTGGTPLKDAQLQWDLSASPAIPQYVYLDYASDEIAIIRLTFLRQAADTTPVMTDEVKVAHFSNGVGAIDSLQPAVAAIDGLGSVELMSGNLHLSALVRSYQTPAFGPELMLSYNHLNGIETSLGRGWRTTYDERLFDGVFDRQTGSSTDTSRKITVEDYRKGDLLVLLDGSGRSCLFTWDEAKKKYLSIDATGLIKATVEPLQEIVSSPTLAQYNADDLKNGYKVVLFDNLIRWFDRDGYLMRIERLTTEKLDVTRGQADAGNPWKFKHRAVKVTDNYRREEGLAPADYGATLDTTERTINAIDKRQLAQWAFEYDTAQRLVKATITGSETSHFSLKGGGDSLVWGIAYDLVSPSDPGASINKVLKITIPFNSAAVNIAYTPDTRMIASTAVNVTGPAPFGGVTTWSDIVPETGAWKKRVIPGEIQVTTERTIDAATRRLLTETTGRVIITNKYADTHGAMTESSVSGGTTTTWTHQDFGITDAWLLDTTTLVGAEGITKRTYATAGKQKGLVLTVTDPCQVKMTYGYKAGTPFVETEQINNRKPWKNAVDQWGNCTLRTSPMGRTTDITWLDGGKWGLSEKTTDFLTNENASRYDSRLRITSVTLPTGGLVLTSYDPLNRAVAVTDALQTKTTTTYDKLGRIDQVSTIAGGSVVAPAPTAPTKYAYLDGPKTRVTATCDGVILSDRIFDLQGRTLSNIAHRVREAGKAPVECPVTTTKFSVEGWPTIITNAQQKNTQIEYDAAGRVVLVTSPRSAKTETHYNTAGWVDLVKNPDGHTVQYTAFDGCGRVKTVVNPKNGSITTVYAFPDEGDTVTTTPSLGAGESTSYDLDGLLKQSTDRFGNLHTYAYFKPISLFGVPFVAARMTETQTVKPTGKPGVDVVRTTFFAQGIYAGSAVSGITKPSVVGHDLNGAANTTINSFGGTTTVGLSQYGNVLTSSVQQSGSVTANSQTAVSAVGLVTAHTSVLGNVTVPVTSPITGEGVSSSDSVTRAPADAQIANAVVLTRDANGNVLTWTDAGQRPWSATYTDDTQQATLTAPDKSTTTTLYTLGGLPSQSDTSLGATLIAQSEMRYDELDNVVFTKDIEGHETHADYDVFGLLQSSTVRGQQTTYLYGTQTRQLLLTTLPGYLTIRRGYDEYGRQISLTDSNFAVTNFAYDELGRPVLTTHPLVPSYTLSASASASRAAAAPVMTAYQESITYDPATGAVADVTDMGAGLTSVTSRDLQGRPTSVVHRPGSTSIDALTVTTTYDEAGNWKRRSLAPQSYVEQELDARGRRSRFTGSVSRTSVSAIPRAIDEPVATPVAAAAAAALPTTPIVQTITSTQYNDDTFLSKTAGNNTWKATLNPLGQLQQFSLSAPTEPSGTPVTVGYDGSNRVARLDLPGGVVRIMTYTPGGRVATMTETVGPQQITYANTYDPVTARLTTITGPGYAQSLYYSAAGRLTVDERIGSEPWQKLYGYDNNGNRTTSVIQTGGESVLLRFSGAIPPEVVAQSGQWDVDQQQLRVQMGPGPLTGKGLAQIATSGRPTRLSAQVQVGSTATFAGFQPRVSGTTGYHVGFLANPDGRFTLVATVTKGARQVETVLATSEPFALPSRSATLSLTQLPGSSSWMITCLENNVAIVAALGSLAVDHFQIEARGPQAVSSEVRFTSIGWQIGGTRKSRTMTYDALNRLRTIRGSENTDYTYEPVGDITAITTTTATNTTVRSFVYDSLHRQTGAKKEIIPVATGIKRTLFDHRYLYYGPTMIRAGVQTSPTAPTTTFMADESGALSETIGSDTTAYARLSNTPLWQTSTRSGLFTYLQDGRGNVMGLVRDSMRLFNFVYDAFGVVTATDSSGRTTSVPPGPRYRGAYYDSATGEYLMGERFYDPATGTFMTEDPARAGGNWYSYCGGDPVNFSDPNGLWRISNDTGSAEAEPGDTIFSLWQQLGGNASGMGWDQFQGSVGYFNPGRNQGSVGVGDTWRFGFDRNSAFIAFDGTANHYLLPSDAGGTNPRMMFELSNTSSRFYYGGVGNAHEYGPIDQKRGMIEGWGAGAIVDRAIVDVRQAYSRGVRRVDAVGFSRGAAQNVEFAFRLQGLIASGELAGLQLGFFGFFDAVPAFHRNVWDGNASGSGMTHLPRTPSGSFFSSDTSLAEHQAYKVTLPKMLSAVHLVALDENRVDFAPLNIQGAWQFGWPGAHSNTGAGYRNKGLSNGALHLMVDYARRSGAPLGTVAQAAGRSPEAAARFGPYLPVDTAMLPHRQLRAFDVPAWGYAASPVGGYAAQQAAYYEQAPRYLPPMHAIFPGWTPPMSYNGSRWVFANPNFTRE